MGEAATRRRNQNAEIGGVSRKRMVLRSDESCHGFGHELAGGWGVLHGAEEDFTQWAEPFVIGLEPGGELAGGEAVVT